MQRTLRPPIFLIGNYRSGTSIVQRLIGLHPDIVTWYEPRTLWLYANPARPHDEFDENDVTEKVRSYIRGRFLKYQSWHGGRRIMEKTPANVFKVPYVDAIFPDACYLYIVRHPFSVLSSMELKWQKMKSLKGIRRSLKSTPLTQLPFYAGQFAEDFARKKILGRKYTSIYGPRYKGIEEDLRNHDILTVIARQWAIGNERARQDLAKLGKDRVFSFRYEDLMDCPQRLFHQIYQHCGLQYNDDMLRLAEKMVDPGRQKKWQRLDWGQIESILPELHTEMDVHGYRVPHLDDIDSAGTPLMLN